MVTVRDLHFTSLKQKCKQNHSHWSIVPTICGKFLMFDITHNFTFPNLTGDCYREPRLTHYSGETHPCHSCQIKLVNMARRDLSLAVLPKKYLSYLISSYLMILMISISILCPQEVDFYHFHEIDRC